MNKECVRCTVNSYPEGFRKDFETFLYNEPKHLDLQSESDRSTFYIISEAKRKVLGRICFFIPDKKVYSPLKSPFGSLEFNSMLPLNILSDFLEFIVDHFRKQDIYAIKIKNYASVYAPQQSAKLTNVLLNGGFSIIHPDLNHHINVDEKPFEDIIHKMELRKLRKCIERGFTFSEEAPSSLNEIYHFIQLCRKERSQPISISLDNLKNAVSYFPRQYKIFSIRYHGMLAAATIAVEVNRKILYNFLPASARQYNPYSPMVFLLANLYEYCRRKGYSVLDLGISSIDNEPQLGLMKFKERVGGKSSLKMTFELNSKKLADL